MNKVILIFVLAQMSFAVYAQNQPQKLQPLSNISSEFPNPEMNFLPSGNIRSAGDINGDGFQDFFYQVFAGNSETDDLSDNLIKTKLYLGSVAGVSEENSVTYADSNSIFKPNIQFTSDITGDGINEGYLRQQDEITIYSVQSKDDPTQVESKVIKTGYTWQYMQIKDHGDFNNDGFNDLIVFESTVFESNSANFTIILGAANIEDVDTLIINNDLVIDERRYEEILYGDIEGDGSTEVIQVAGLRDADEANIYIYSLDAQNALIPKDTLTYPDIYFSVSQLRSTHPMLLDLNGDNFKEFITYTGRTAILTMGDSNSQTYDDVNYSEFVGGLYSNIGDFNDDGFNDLIFYGNSELDIQVVFGDAELNLNSVTPDLGVGEYSSLSTIYFTNNKVGDVNGDGIDDIALLFEKENSYGFEIILGNVDNSFSNNSTVEFSEPFPSLEYPRFTVNVGDLNNDGIDDYGISYVSFVNNEESFNRFEVFFGGDLTKTDPDLVISHPDKYQMSNPVSGDFNGDGFYDIALNFQSKEAGINIYYGGMSMDNVADYELLFNDFFSNVTPSSNADIGFTRIQNAGDFNNDGFDDFIFSSNQVSFLNKSYMIFGSENISQSSDLEINLLGTNFVPLKDFDGDGINDLALSYTPFEIIRIYKGFDSTNDETFDENNYTLILKSSSIENNVMLQGFGAFMESGDFNGDGFSDLVTAPYRHYEESDINIGAKSHYIYLGGQEADSLPDFRFGLQTSLYSSANTDLSSKYLTEFYGELTVVPDQNGDGTDEILVGTSSVNYGLTNAAVYYGATDVTEINEEADILLESPNQSLGLGAYINFSEYQIGHSAVGDFNGDRKNDFLLGQGYDFNFVKSPVYIFSSDQFSVENEEEIETIANFRLNQNYPNPFNPSTNISYSIPQTTDVSLKIYDVTGRLVSTLVNKRQTSGSYDVTLNASAWASGIYFYRIVAGDFVKTRKLTLIK